MAAKPFWDKPPDWLDRAPPPDGPAPGQGSSPAGDRKNWPEWMAPDSVPVQAPLYIDRDVPRPGVLEEARRMRRERALNYWHLHPRECPMPFETYWQQVEGEKHVEA